MIYLAKKCGLSLGLDLDRTRLMQKSVWWWYTAIREVILKNTILQPKAISRGLCVRTMAIADFIEVMDCPLHVVVSTDSSAHVHKDCEGRRHILLS